jgi:hypothetical protein
VSDREMGRIERFPAEGFVLCSFVGSLVRLFVRLLMSTI